MNILSVIYITCSFITFESAVTTFRLNRRAPGNILFGIFSFSTSLFFIFFSQMVASPDMESAMRWHMATTIPGMFIAMMTFHFTLALTGYKRWAFKPLLFLPLYIPSLYFLVRIYQGAIITGVGRTPWGWDVVYDQDSIEPIMGILHGVLCLAASILLILRWYYRAESVLEKKQARPIAMAFAAGAGGLTVVMIHLFGNDPFYNTLISDIAFAFLYTLFILGVRFSISRYKLMNLHPDVPVISIMMGMNEACLLVDTDGNIICMNREGSRLIKGQEKKKIYEIFVVPENVREEIRELARSKKGTITVQCYKNEKKQADAFTLFNKVIWCVTDEGGALSGFFVVITEERSTSDFQCIYNLTARQMEIVHLVVSGLSNIEIADHLKLSERTVENHLFNIYNKIGIDNKIELVKTAAKYKFLPEL